MKLGVFAVLLSSQSLEDALKYFSQCGIQAVELGTGAYPGNAHVNTDELLADPGKIVALKELVQKYNMEISALSCHGNPVHPQKEIADKFHSDFEKNSIGCWKTWN